MLAVYVGAAVASTRGVFAMARDRRLPGAARRRVAASSGPRSGAIVLLMAVQALLIVAAEGNDTLLALAGPPALLLGLRLVRHLRRASRCVVVYLLMSVGGMCGMSDDETSSSLVLAAIVGILVSGAAIFGSFYKVPSPTLLAPWAAVIWVVLGLLYMLAVKGREPASEALKELHSSAGDRR